MDWLTIHVIYRYLDLVMLAGIVLPLTMFLIIKRTITQGRTRSVR